MKSISLINQEFIINGKVRGRAGMMICDEWGSWFVP